MNEQIIVLVAASNDQGEILLLRRAEGVHCGGFWSLPGGKLEAKEIPIRAAMRELTEETGLTGEDWHRLGETQHRYPDRTLSFELFACVCPDLSGFTPESEAAWVAPDRLHAYAMPEANRALLPLLRREAQA